MSEMVGFLQHDFASELVSAAMGLGWGDGEVASRKEGGREGGSAS